MKRLRLIALFVVLIGSGCTFIGPPIEPPYNPFKLSEEQLHARVKTIALAPLSVPDSLQNPEPVKAKFESMIAAKLREQGFAVVPSREYDAIWKRIMKQAGPLYDRVTGRRDESKYKAVRSDTLREMNAKFKADAVLHPAIIVVTASFFSNRAQWDGSSESIFAVKSLLGSISGADSCGTIQALSLRVSIEDLNQVQMYVDQGGIRLSANISGGDYVFVPRSRLFADDERNAAAVDLALDSLEQKSPASQGSGAGPAKGK